MELWAALVGGAISLAGVGVTLWWTNRGEQARLDQEQLVRIRSEKRRIYADATRALDFFRDAAFEIGEARKRDRDWQRYWSAREKCMRAGAELQLIGTYEMIDGYSEALDLLMGIGFQFFDHPDLNPSMQNQATIRQYVYSHTHACDRETEKLRDLMRIDLGYPPLAPAIELAHQRALAQMPEEFRRAHADSTEQLVESATRQKAWLPIERLLARLRRTLRGSK